LTLSAWISVLVSSACTIYTQYPKIFMNKVARNVYDDVHKDKEIIHYQNIHWNGCFSWSTVLAHIILSPIINLQKVCLIQEMMMMEKLSISSNDGKLLWKWSSWKAKFSFA
jgi:hypothetical protein